MSDPVTPDLCPVGMEFPVDVLGSVRHEEEEQAAESYMTQLRYVSPDKAESFTLPSHRMICISLCNVGFVPIYGGELKHKILVLVQDILSDTKLNVQAVCKSEFKD